MYVCVVMVSPFFVVFHLVGQTPLDLAEDDDMEEFLKAHLTDMKSSGADRKAWRFDGAWRSNGECQWDLMLVSGNK